MLRPDILWFELLAHFKFTLELIYLIAAKVVVN